MIVSTRAATLNQTHFAACFIIPPSGGRRSARGRTDLSSTFKEAEETAPVDIVALVGEFPVVVVPHIGDLAVFVGVFLED